MSEVTVDFEFFNSLTSSISGLDSPVKMDFLFVSLDAGGVVNVIRTNTNKAAHTTVTPLRVSNPRMCEPKLEPILVFPLCTQRNYKSWHRICLYVNFFSKPPNVRCAGYKETANGPFPYKLHFKLVLQTRFVPSESQNKGRTSKMYFYRIYITPRGQLTDTTFLKSL